MLAVVWGFGYKSSVKTRVLLLLLLVSHGLIFSPGLRAATLQSATVTQTQNVVQLDKDGTKARPAVVKDVVAGKDILRTGKKSRAEVLFNDNTIARLGSSSIFSFAPGTDQMNIDRGSALIHVPPGQTGAKIKSPAATVAVLGDVVAMRVDDRGVTQVVALSEDPRGPVTVTSNKTGEKRELKAGEMIVIDPTEVTMPDISTISVEVFSQSSSLVNGFGGSLPETARSEIRQSTEAQTRQIKNGELESGSGEADAGSQNLPSTDPTSIQASVGSTVGGTYKGLAKDFPPGITVADMVLNINSDGSFTGSLRDTVTLFTSTFSGVSSTDGSFKATSSSGININGNVALGGNTAGGTYNTSLGFNGAFNVKK